MKKLSGMFSLSTRDFLRSAILSAIAPGVIELAQTFSNGTVPDFADVKRLGIIAVGVFLTSIGMKLTTDYKKVAEDFVNQKKEKDENQAI